MTDTKHQVDWKFQPEDFYSFNHKTIPGEKDVFDCIAEIANAKLEEWLKDAKLVYCIENQTDGTEWQEYYCDGDTHQAMLVRIRKIEK